MDELLDEFFDSSFESVITENMLERDYQFPLSQVEDYVLDVVSTPYQQFIDYVYTHYCNKSIETSCVPQISSYDAATRGVCQVLKGRNDPGLEYIEIGVALFSDDTPRNDGAYLKFGENHVKGATFHGLTYNLYKKWFLTCLGYVYPDYDDELRQYISSRTLLRSPFFHIVVAEAVEHDVNIQKYMSGLKPSTQKRRSSSCLHFFDVIKRQCEIENVRLHPIFFSENENSQEDLF